jgi:hypothetical protein
LVQLEGRAVMPTPLRAAVTGRPCVWWDASVDLWHVDGDKNGTWRQAASRHAGNIDVVEIADKTGRLPVWLKGCELLLANERWESQMDTLPPEGVEWLDGLGFPWRGGQRIRVSEQCLQTDAALFVWGTLDHRRNIPEPAPAAGLERLKELLRTGEWRRALVSAVPAPGRVVAAVFIGFLDMFTQIGHGAERVPSADESTPPHIAPDALLVWKGRGGRPFLVSDRPKPEALASLRQRSWIFGAAGAAIMGCALYLLAPMFGR